LRKEVKKELRERKLTELAPRTRRDLGEGVRMDHVHRIGFGMYLALSLGFGWLGYPGAVGPPVTRATGHLDDGTRLELVAQGRNGPWVDWALHFRGRDGAVRVAPLGEFRGEDRPINVRLEDRTGDGRPDVVFSRTRTNIEGAKSHSLVVVPAGLHGKIRRAGRAG
jgi:hypothetical protein